MKAKDLIYQRFSEFRILFWGLCLSALLLALRIKLSHSFFFLFLGWNLILGFIPFWITFLLQVYPGLWAKTYLRFLIFSLWLLFLPNAPYILTDFIHLRLSKPIEAPFDTLLVASFAATAWLAGLYSLRDMKRFLLLEYPEKAVRMMIYAMCFLAGLGVYLGRFIRFNSWDFILNPLEVATITLRNFSSPLCIFTTISIGLLMMYTLNSLPKK